MNEDDRIDGPRPSLQGGATRYTPASINPDRTRHGAPRRSRTWSVDDYVDGVLDGDLVVLGRAITLIESTLPAHQDLAEQILERCLPHAGGSIRVGITGVPGAGKSTFIEAFGRRLTGHGHRLAVLAIDPSSSRSGGSILGDKTRMEGLSSDPDAFIRPSPTAGSLGGVARKTRETISLCEAAGYDTVLVETVGVGQSETAVHAMVDFFLVLALTGAGDALQGIKRGILEMADAVAINKADGDNLERARQARQEYLGALRLFPPKPSGWAPRVHTCSALTGQGLDRIWDTIEEYRTEVSASGYLATRRREQAREWMHETVRDQLVAHLYDQPAVKAALRALEADVAEGHKSSSAAARELLAIYRDGRARREETPDED